MNAVKLRVVNIRVVNIRNNMPLSKIYNTIKSLVCGTIPFVRVCYNDVHQYSGKLQ